MARKVYIETHYELQEIIHGIFSRIDAFGVLTARQLEEGFQIGSSSVKRWRKKVPGKRGKKKLPDLYRNWITARLKEIADRRVVIGDKVLVPYPSYTSIAACFSREEGHEHDEHISVMTVSRYLNAVGYHCRVRPKHPGLHKKEVRYAFAAKWRRRDPSIIVFSDEHYISTNDHSVRTMIVRPGDQPLPLDSQRRQNVPYFQIWAAIGVGWRSPLVFFPLRKKDDDGQSKGFRLRAPYYTRQCLSKIRAHVADNGLIFMQDGAGCHWSENVTNYFKRHNMSFMDDFPAFSPDLNPIESVWNDLDRFISQRQPSTPEELRAAALWAWEAMPQAMIDAHVLNFRAKCCRVYDRMGV